MSGSEWRFLLDENLGYTLRDRLRERGYHARMVVNVDELGDGADDYADIVPFADENGYVVVTMDGDFHSVSFRDHEGIVGIEDRTVAETEVARALDRLAEDFGAAGEMDFRIKLDRYL